MDDSVQRLMRERVARMMAILEAFLDRHEKCTLQVVSDAQNDEVTEEFLEAQYADADQGSGSLELSNWTEFILENDEPLWLIWDAIEGVKTRDRSAFSYDVLERMAQAPPPGHWVNEMNSGAQRKS